MLLVSWRFVPWTTHGAQIGKQYIKGFGLRFLGKYRMNQLRSKLISFESCFPANATTINALYTVTGVR